MYVVLFVIFATKMTLIKVFGAKQLFLAFLRQNALNQGFWSKTAVLILPATKMHCLLSSVFIAFETKISLLALVSLVQQKYLTNKFRDRLLTWQGHLYRKYISPT